MFRIQLRRIRRERGLTQREFAGRLEVAPQTVSKWERGLSMPDENTLLRIAGELGVSFPSLFGGE